MAQALDLVLVEVVVEVEAVLWSRRAIWSGGIPELAIFGSGSGWKGRLVCRAKLGDKSFTLFGCQCMRKLAKCIYRERTHDDVRKLSGKGDALKERAVGANAGAASFATRASAIKARAAHALSRKAASHRRKVSSKQTRNARSVLQ